MFRFYPVPQCQSSVLLPWQICLHNNLEDQVWIQHFQAFSVLKEGVCGSPILLLTFGSFRDHEAPLCMYGGHARPHAWVLTNYPPPWSPKQQPCAYWWHVCPLEDRRVTLPHGPCWLACAICVGKSKISFSSRCLKEEHVPRSHNCLLPRKGQGWRMGRAGPLNLPEQVFLLP